MRARFGKHRALALASIALGAVVACTGDEFSKADAPSDAGVVGAMDSGGAPSSDAGDAGDAGVLLPCSVDGAGPGCLPEALAEAQAAPSAIAVSHGFVFWGAGTAVLTCPVSSCAGEYPKPVMSLGSTVRSLAASPDALYAVAGGSISRCRLPACETTEPFVTSHSPTMLAVDDAWVFWSDTTSDVRRCAQAGECDAGAAMATIGSEPLGVAVDAFHVYWTVFDRVVKCAKTGGGCGATPVDVMPFVMAGGRPQFLAVRGDDVFVTRAEQGDVLRCKTSGCSTLTTFASEQGIVRMIVTDDANVYWTIEIGKDGGMGDGAVVACPLAGCPPSGPRVLASKQERPYALAVDATHVYWVNRTGAGAVMRVRK